MTTDTTHHLASNDLNAVLSVNGANMSMEWIRRNYGVPAKRGGRVRFFGAEGTIASATHYLRVRMDDGKRVLLHPTWQVEYL